MKLEETKMIVNEMLIANKRHERGECSYNRLLEDVANIITKSMSQQPILGYVKTGTVQNILMKVLNTKKVDPDNKRIFNCQLDKVDMDTIERILNN